MKTKRIKRQAAFVLHHGLEVPASSGFDALATTSCMGRFRLILGVGLGGEKVYVLKGLKFLCCFDIFELQRAPKT